MAFTPTDRTTDPTLTEDPAATTDLKKTAGQIQVPQTMAGTNQIPPAQQALSTAQASTTDPMAFTPTGGGGGDAAPQAAGTGAAYAPGTLIPANPLGPTTTPQGFISGTAAGGSPGVLGQSFVPGSGGNLVDLGGGQFAPTPGTQSGQGVSYGGPTSVLQGTGALTPQQYQQAGLYGTSAYDPTKAGFQAIYRDPNGGYVFAPAGFDPRQLPQGATLVSGSGPSGSDIPRFDWQTMGQAANPTDFALDAAAGLPVPSNVPTAASSGATRGFAPTDRTGIGDVIPSTGQSYAPPSASLSPSSPTTTGSIGAAIQQALGPASATSGTGGSTGSNAGVGLTPTDASNALTDQTITPNNTVDRVQQFQNSLNSTIQNVLDPAYQARLRDQNRYNFGRGQGVSGQGRTATGTIASDYGNQIANLAAQGLSNANVGSIDDLYRNIGIAQQQQGFQAGQQQNAFNQQMSLAQLQDALTNSQFGRALAQENAGYANDPSQIGLILSQIFGQQATGAGNAAAGLFGQQGRQQGAGTGLTTDQLLALLGIKPSVSGPPTTTAPPGTPNNVNQSIFETA